MTSLHPTPPRHRRPVPSLRIALLGAPADGLDTTAAELGRRLAHRGHDVTLYGQAPAAGQAEGRGGLRRMRLPALRGPSLEPLRHTAHLLAGRRLDVALLLGAAHVPLIPVIRGRGTAVAVHSDAVRPDQDAPERRSARTAERLAIREADALIAGAQSVQDDYDDDFGLPTHLIGYGATVLRNTPTDLLEQLGLVPGGFHLVVARFERGHRVDVVVEGYHRSGARLPLVVVGAAARPTPYSEHVLQLTAKDGRIRLLGAVDDERLLDQLHAHAAASIHGAAGGVTDPALLRAMGAGTAVLAWEARRNREVAGTGGSYFSSPALLARQIEEVERYPFRFRDLGELMQERARTRHDWKVVTEQWEALAAKLARGYSTRGMCSGRPLRASPVPVAAPFTS